MPNQGHFSETYKCDLLAEIRGISQVDKLSMVIERTYFSIRSPTHSRSVRLIHKKTSFTEAFFISSARVNLVSTKYNSAVWSALRKTSLMAFVNCYNPMQLVHLCRQIKTFQFSLMILQKFHDAGATTNRPHRPAEMRGLFGNCASHVSNKTCFHQASAWSSIVEAFINVTEKQ